MYQLSQNIDVTGQLLLSGIITFCLGQDTHTLFQILAICNHTINRFFENNLNVSETARKLYVHRNTLVYRLEKVKKITGLDLREFEDAILFKVAVMVKKYLDSQNTAKF